ncbi:MULTISPECIES: site-specific DNA-methyltransferase [Campylobacter]|uniref:DNA-methyltransferase n=1 Tax=Campylobacter TaxID=194 RepID=UPI0023F10005|nr:MULTISPECIES: site-specific DNA-methyltransferase [Campylobacter]MCI6641736.1 site-specific DNA-methyltransferase [Campylobacter sp.]MDD7422935.1 site-specific DNA-methyltransferase [Campylobacter hominis]MDY3117326.1 site-specific DNA-methyltransferase [Campylobacter hominis]
MIKNTILQGDCLKILKTLPDKSIDLIFADPPYWMRVDGILKRPEGENFSGCDDKWDNNFLNNDDYSLFTEKWLNECKRVLKDDGSIWVIGGMQCIYTIGGIMQALGFWFINDVIWQKSNPTPNFMGTRLNNSHETLIWACKSKKSKFTFNYKTAKELNNENIERSLFEKGLRKQLGSVWKFAVCSGNERLKDENGEKLHNTQKPEILLYRLIAISSNIGDLILDPFGGTMTTAAMAKKLGRNFIMIEENEKYIKFGKYRIESVKFENSDIAKAKFDEKPIKVSLSDMILNKFFNVGEKFYLKNTNLNATLNKDAKLEYNGKIYDIHTLAAILKNSKAKRLNGFNYWEVLRNRKKISIATIRENFRNFIINK